MQHSVTPITHEINEYKQNRLPLETTSAKFSATTNSPPPPPPLPMDEVLRYIIHQNFTGRNLFQRHRQKSEGVGKVFSKGSDKNPTSRNLIIHRGCSDYKWNVPLSSLHTLHKDILHEVTI